MADSPAVTEQSWDYGLAEPWHPDVAGLFVEDMLWLGVAALCALATPLGYALAAGTGGHFRAGINGFAAGALIVMLVDSMIPEATTKSGRVAGLATTLGFAVAAGLSTLSA